MARFDETPSAIDPLDEAYSLAPPAVELPPSRESYSPPEENASAEGIALGEQQGPLVARSLPLHTNRFSRQAFEAPGEVEPARLSDPARFTLRNLLWVITMASIVLAVGVRFPRPYFAGAAGLAALATAVSASWLRHSGAVMQLAWWTLLGIYLMACGFAIVGM